MLDRAYKLMALVGFLGTLSIFLLGAGAIVMPEYAQRLAQWFVQIDDAYVVDKLEIRNGLESEGGTTTAGIYTDSDTGLVYAVMDGIQCRPYFSSTLPPVLSQEGMVSCWITSETASLGVIEQGQRVELVCDPVNGLNANGMVVWLNGAAYSLRSMDWSIF